MAGALPTSVPDGQPARLPLPVLTVELAGSGTGTVTSSPGGIECEPDCRAKFDDGAAVVLTATAGRGSFFAGWEGNGCSGKERCPLTMDAERRVTASFERGPSNVLSVEISGDGSGTVTSSTSGISDCDTGCEASFRENSTVHLTATAADGSVFTGWTGDCSGMSRCDPKMVTDRAVTATFVQDPSSHQLDIRTAGDGRVTSTPPGIDCRLVCEASFAENEKVELEAEEAPGSAFVGWEGDCEGEEQICVVEMSGDRSVTAAFTPEVRYALRVERAGGGAGNVSSSPGEIDCGSSCEASFVAGTVVTLTAGEDAGSRFTGWSGAPGCADDGRCRVTMDADATVTATFERLPAEHELTVEILGDGRGTVTSVPSGINCNDPCGASFHEGKEVTLTARGSTFVGWGGDCSAETATCSLTMDADHAVTATFGRGGPPPHTLVVEKRGNGSGTVTSSPSGIGCGSACAASFDDGERVTLDSRADPGSTFAGWSACSGTPCTVQMTSDRSVVATFVLRPVEEALLAIRTVGSGSGTVRSSPAGIECRGRCEAPFRRLEPVALVARPDRGSRFVGWSACAGTARCLVTMLADRTVTAEFERLSYELSVSVKGNGRVTSSPEGIACRTDCTQRFPWGTRVSLVARPGAKAVFRSWGGAAAAAGRRRGSCRATPCEVRILRPTRVTASFAGPFPLTVSREGDGAGNVTSKPAGIACGRDCRQRYKPGRRVTLSATEARGSSFAGWSGACHGNAPCTVTMNTQKLVRARFMQEHRQLNVSKAGSGVGRVTSDRGGIDCGSECSASYVFDSTVTLTATAQPGSEFDGWSGACAGRGACRVAMDANRAVTARFTGYRQLTVSKAGDGSGSVSSDVAGIDCGADCGAPYALGTDVTLTASAMPGSRFDGWSGACAGRGACRVTMDVDRSVTARFRTLASICAASGQSPGSQVTFNFTVVGHSALSGCELDGDTLPRGMNAAAALYHAPGKTYVYVGNRTDGSDRCADAGSGCAHPHPGILVVDATDPGLPAVVGEVPPPLNADGRPEGLSTRELQVWPDKRLLIVMNDPCGSRLEACDADEPAELGAADPRYPASIAFYDLSDPVHPTLVWTYTPRSKAGEPLPARQMSLWVDPNDAGRALLWLSTPTLSVDPGRPNMTVVDISGVARRAPVAEVVEVAEGNWNGLLPHADEPAHYDGHLYADSATPTADGRLTYVALRRGGFLVLKTADIATDRVPRGSVESLSEPAVWPHDGLVTHLADWIFWQESQRRCSTVPRDRILGCLETHAVIPVPGRPFVLTTNEVYGTFANPFFGWPWGWARLYGVVEPPHPYYVWRYKLPENTLPFLQADIDDATREFTSYSSDGATVTPHLALVTWHSGGLQAIDLLVPPRPTQVGAFSPEPLPAVATEDPALSRGPSKVVMWGYPIVDRGLIYVVDIRNGLYILSYTGPHANELDQLSSLQGNSNVGSAAAAAIVASGGP